MCRLRLLIIIFSTFTLVSCSSPLSFSNITQSVGPYSAPTQEIVHKVQTEISIENQPPTQTPPEKETINTPEKNNDSALQSFMTPIKYKIDAGYDFIEKIIHIKEEIFYPINDENLNKIILINEIGRKSPDFSLVDLRLDGEPVTNYDSSSGILDIPLEKEIEVGNQLNISIVYTAEIPNQSAKFGYTNNQVNFGDWYLFAAPYLPDSGWVIHEASKVGEYLNYPVASFSIKFELVNAPGDIIIAASSIPIKVSTNNYYFELEQARNFVLSLSTEYAVSSVTVNKTKIISYYYPENRAAGEAALEASADAYNLFTDTFGNIALDSLSLVEGEFLDGMEYHGFYFLGQEYYWEYTGNPKSYLTTIAVHETAHQWFYSLIANDQALEPWLDEAICTYLEAFFYEVYYPELVPWWWQYRVLRFNPSGWVNSSIYDHDNFRDYVDAVYLRGAMWLRDLRTLLGDPGFIKVLSDYVSGNSYSFATSRDFFASINLNTSMEIKDLYTEYFIDTD